MSIERAAQARRRIEDGFHLAVLLERR